MCSSPKGSTARRPHAKQKILSSAEYEEYASMLRRSSIVYEQAQERKAARRKQSAAKSKLMTSPIRAQETHIWTRIKIFLT